jgi:uncharacterized protein DUF2877
MGSRAHLLTTGEFAWSCLTNERQGRVLASTSRTLWLMTDGGQLFWLADAEAPMHRRCGTLDGGVPKIAADTPYAVRGDQLVIGPDHKMELGTPQMWHTPLPARAAPGKIIASSVYNLTQSIIVAQGIGFAALLPRVRSTLDAEVTLPGGEFGDATLKRAEPLVVGLVQAGTAGNLDEMMSMADGLVGLGPGLTPSGDDFLGGLLFAMRTWEMVFPAEVKRSAGISIERYARRTHLISFTLLSDMAKGHAIAPMHELVDGLISAESPDGIHCCAMDLIRVGHSTGWELLTGLLTGLLIGIQAQEG